nr:hypothetical protein [Leptospira noguchii]
MRKDALLENVVYDPQTKVVDYSSLQKRKILEFLSDFPYQ